MFSHQFFSDTSPPSTPLKAHPHTVTNDCNPRFISRLPQMSSNPNSKLSDRDKEARCSEYQDFPSSSLFTSFRLCLDCLGNLKGTVMTSPCITKTGSILRSSRMKAIKPRISTAVNGMGTDNRKKTVPTVLSYFSEIKGGGK